MVDNVFVLLSCLLCNDDGDVGRAEVEDEDEEEEDEEEEGEVLE